MLDGANGRLSLPSGLVVGPNTTLAHFKADTAFATARLSVKNKPFATYTLEAGALEDRTVFVSLTFEGQPLRSVSLTFALEDGSGAWGDSPKELAATKSVHDAWLARWLGRPHAKRDGDLQFLLPWGEVWSCIDPRAGEAAITVRYR